MDMGFSLIDEKFRLFLRSEQPYDIICSLYRGGLPIPQPHPKRWKHDVWCEQWGDPLVMRQELAIDGLSFVVKSEFTGWEDLPTLERDHLEQSRLSSVSQSYTIEGDAALLPFVADCVNVIFWDSRDSGSYETVRPFLFNAKQHVKNPARVNWLEPLLEEQREFIAKPPKGVDRDILPVLKACSDFANTDCSCAGGFKPAFDREYRLRLTTFGKSTCHNIDEFFRSKHVEQVLIRGGYLSPEDIRVFGTTDHAGIQRLDRVHDQLKREYDTVLYHPTGTDINPFELRVRPCKSRIPIKPYLRVDALFEPYTRARELCADLVKECSKK